MLKLIDRYLVTMEDRVVFSDRSRHVRGREMLDAAALVDRIPQIDRIPSMDALFDAFRDLASRYPRLFRLLRIGTSRLGEPLIMLTTGRGPKQALLVGGPHPNEPIGFLTLLHLARRRADDHRALSPALLPAGAQKPARVDVSYEPRARLLRPSAAGDAGADASDRRTPPAFPIFAAQRRFWRGVLRAQPRHSRAGGQARRNRA